VHQDNVNLSGKRKMKIRSIKFTLPDMKPIQDLLVIVLLFLTVSCNRNPDSKYSVMKGAFRQSVTETGELQAVNASFLGMPRINYV